MSISKTANYIEKYDEKLVGGIEKLTFNASHIKYDIIQDTNQGNYNTNSVNFNSLTSQGISPDVLQCWNQAYHDLPTQVTLTLKVEPDYDTAGTLTAANYANLNTDLAFDISDNTQNYALSVKSNLHMYDYVGIKWSNVEVAQNNHYVNLYRNMQLLNWDNKKVKLHGKLINYELDNGESIDYVPNIGETNNKIYVSNNTSTFVGTLTDGAVLSNAVTNKAVTGTFTPAVVIPGSDSSKVNLAQYNRSKTMNYPLTDGTNLNLNANIGINKMGGITSLQTREIVFHWNLRTPLCLIHDFFDKIPSTGTVNNFDIKFTMNAGLATKWVIYYQIVVDGTSKKVTSVKPFEIQYRKGAGNTCPYLLSELGNGTGLNLDPTFFTHQFQAGGTYYASVTLDTMLGSKTTPGNPSAIYLPSIKYHGDISKRIFLQSKMDIYYNDFLMEEMRSVGITSKGSTTSIKRTFNNQFVKVNKLYIIPILSNDEAQKSGKLSTGTKPLLLPYESPLSSCPNTFNKGLKLKDIQLFVGTQPVFPIELREENEFYHQQLMSFFASNDDGNIIQSGENDTQLTYDRFRNGYGVYVLDLVQTTDPIQWASPKTFHLNFKFESNYVWDFIFLFEQQKSLIMDRASGLLNSEENR